METDKGPVRYTVSLIVLLVFALFLMLHLLYMFLSDASRFPVNTIKISATFQHISHKQLETVLEKYVNSSFFFLQVTKLKQELQSLDWIEDVDIERTWPDALNISLVERKPIAIWNNALLLKNGDTFSEGQVSETLALPHLKGSANQALEVLHVYEKISNILSGYGLQAQTLEWRKNEAWELTLSDGVILRLGKRFSLQRLERFCKAYPAVSKGRVEKLVSVDLRYPRGMAIQWK